MFPVSPRKNAGPMPHRSSLRTQIQRIVSKGAAWRWFSIAQSGIQEIPKRRAVAAPRPPDWHQVFISDWAQSVPVIDSCRLWSRCPSECPRLDGANDSAGAWCKVRAIPCVVRRKRLARCT